MKNDFLLELILELACDKLANFIRNVILKNKFVIPSYVLNVWLSFYFIFKMMVVVFYSFEFLFWRYKIYIFIIKLAFDFVHKIFFDDDNFNI